MSAIISRPNPGQGDLFPWQNPGPSPWQQFRCNPSAFLTHWLYRHKPKTQLLHPVSSPSVSLVCISDTHNTQPAVPDGDVLLHAGDLTERGTFAEIQAQLDWINTLPHRYKVVIAGNHDYLLDPDYAKRHPDRIYEGEGTARADLDWGGITYLHNSSTQLRFSGEGDSERVLNVYGSPQTRQFGAWAFQYPPLRDVWTGTVPDDTDVLLAHGPPKGHLDLDGKGCPHSLRETRRVRPRLAVFGHIHAGHGVEDVDWDDKVLGAFDMVMMGDTKWSTVPAAAWWTVWEWLMTLLGFPPYSRRAVAAGTLVNAAVLVGRYNSPREAVVVCI